MDKIKKTFTKLADGMTPKKLMQFVYDMAGIKYHITHICRIIHSWDLSPKVPQKLHVNAAPVSECRRWRRQVALAIKKAKKKGFSIFVQDESVFFNDARIGKKYWSLASKRLVIPYNGAHQKIIDYGMQNDAGENFFRQYEKFNRKTFLAYLKEAHGKFGKIFVVLDRASQHTAKNVIKYIKECKGRVVLWHLPSGSPRLNSMEECWRQCKHAVLDSECYESFDDMIHTVMEWLRTRRFHLDIYRYFDRVVY